MAKVGVLERRKEYLSRKLEQGGHYRSSAAEFDRSELGAIEAAIRALKYHWATLQPDADPVVALSELISVAQKFVEGNVTPNAIRAQIKKASRIAQEHTKR